LHRYEGIPHLYTFEEVSVDTEDKELNAYAYIYNSEVDNKQEILGGSWVNRGEDIANFS
jgi:gamma-glutamylcyclotransferase (GGCT)/AIG2-like uncharacterized protein YtfP